MWGAACLKLGFVVPEVVDCLHANLSVFRCVSVLLRRASARGPLRGPNGRLSGNVILSCQSRPCRQLPEGFRFQTVCVINYIYKTEREAHLLSQCTLFGKTARWRLETPHRPPASKQCANIGIGSQIRWQTFGDFRRNKLRFQPAGREHGSRQAATPQHRANNGRGLANCVRNARACAQRRIDAHKKAPGARTPGARGRGLGRINTGAGGAFRRKSG